MQGGREGGREGGRDRGRGGREGTWASIISTHMHMYTHQPGFCLSGIDWKLLGPGGSWCIIGLGYGGMPIP